jgi:dihydroorotase-like cyclic amidohydrolase
VLAIENLAFDIMDTWQARCLKSARGQTAMVLLSILSHAYDEALIPVLLLVFPGFIDPHVHIYLPFMGTFAKDTHETASQAALVGGTTTFIEMICPGRADEPMAAFELWLGKAQGRSACDFTFHMGVTRYDESAERQFVEIVKRGLSSFKIFLAYKGALGITDEELYHTLRLAKKLGVITTAHCENADLILELADRQIEGAGQRQAQEGQRHQRLQQAIARIREVGAQRVAQAGGRAEHRARYDVQDDTVERRFEPPNQH